MSSGLSVGETADQEDPQGDQPPPEITFSGGVTLTALGGGVPGAD